MTYILPPLNALRAFEAAARHLSFKLAAHELHVTPAAVGQQVKALEARLGVRLFERLHKQLVLTEAGQPYLPEISSGFRRIANAIETDSWLPEGRPKGDLALLRKTIVQIADNFYGHGHWPLLHDEKRSNRHWPSRPVQRHGVGSRSSIDCAMPRSSMP